MPRSTAPAVAITVGRSLPKIRIAAPAQADSDARLIEFWLHGRNPLTRAT
jgi:hypothetical protein